MMKPAAPPAAPPSGLPAQWAIDDDVIQLRERATARIHPLPEAAARPLTLGTAKGCALRVRDPARRPGEVFARLEQSKGRWTISDAGSARGLWIDGARCDRAELRPGLEISLGGTVTLIAESPRLLRLREALARILGFSPARRAAIDDALRQLRDHDRLRVPLTLCGGPTEYELIPIAQELHRLTLTEELPFVVYNPSRLPERTEGIAPTFSDRATALREAGAGTLCLEHRSLSGRQVITLYAAVLSPDCLTHIVHCGDDPSDPDLPTPRIVVPPLDARKVEIDRLISEYVREAAALLYATKRVRLAPADRAWLRTSACSSLSELRTATLRLVAVREAGNVSGAAALLGFSHVGIGKWLKGRGFAKLEAARKKRTRQAGRRRAH